MLHISGVGKTSQNMKEACWDEVVRMETRKRNQ